MVVVVSAITHWAGEWLPEWLPQWLNHSCYILFQQGHWHFTARGKSCTFLSVSLHAHTWAPVTAVSWRTSVRGNRIRRGDKGFISNTTLMLWFRNQLAEVRKLPSLLHLSTHFQVLSTAFLAPIPWPLTSLSAAASGDLLLSCRHF